MMHGQARRGSPVIIAIAAVLVTALVTTLLATLALRSPDRSSTVTVDRTQPSARLLDRVHARFDRRFPGRGVTDYPGNTVEDIPKSYAMVLLAELDRRRHRIRPDLPSLAGRSGRWLLRNADLAGDGSTGWGVPVAWDAYGDGSENPADTVYAISTAIAVDALVTWMERSRSAPRARILTTVSAALDEFVRTPRTPDGLLPYSLERPDRRWDTFNPAAYLAGQMQRFARYADSPVQAARLRRAADETVASLLRNRRLSPSGGWYWWYSKQEHRANDLPHASYIIAGLDTYVRHGGRLSARIDLRAVARHLKDFVTPAGTPRAWPTFHPEVDLPPRLYDLGIALHLTCSKRRLRPVSETLLATVPRYVSEDGFLKFPAGTPDQDVLVVNEYEAYLWRGLVTCRSVRRSAGHAASRPAAVPARAVPFVRVGASSGTPARVGFAGGWSTLALPWGRHRRVTEDGVVLEAVDDGAGGVLLTRGFPANDFELVTLGPGGAPVGALPVVHTSGSAPMLRAAAVDGGTLHVVYYDNPTLTNYLARYRRGPGGYAPLGDPVALPSLEDPSGGTYEMIPAVFLVGTDDGLHIIGGTLDATVQADGALSVSRVENCSRVLEAIASPTGPVLLCAQEDERGPAAPFELHGPEGVPLPAIDRDAGIPYGLRVAGGSVRVRFASSPRTLAAMLRFDLARTGAGWLEFGTDNVEGRIPWSQIYYLNGFLDFLLLGKDGSDGWQAFTPVLAGMRARLDQELPIATRHWRRGRYETRAFTVDRVPALFAVQTSRLLLAAERYAAEVEEPRGLPGYRRLRTAVTRLTGHIEVLARQGQEPRWWPTGAPYLKWPRGSAFPFDGLNVPYNHQNEWAYALARAGRSEQASRTARSIVAGFLRQIAPGGRLPRSGTWDYWWGQAYDGWTEDDGVSVNMPAYDGDHIKAAASFRSIDAMSALAVAPQLAPRTRSHLRASASRLVRQGHLYPFVSYELRRAGREVRLPRAVVRRHLRVSSPWELQSAAWAYAAELERLRGHR